MDSSVWSHYVVSIQLIFLIPNSFCLYTAQSLPMIDNGVSELERRSQLLLARQRDLTRDKLRAAYRSSKIERKALQATK